MNYQKAFFVALVLDVAFAVAAAFYYSENGGQGAILRKMTEERDALQEKVTTSEEQLKSLRGRLRAMEDGGSGEDDATVARLKLALDEKDAEITRLKLENEQRRDNGRGPRDRRGNRDGGPQLSMEERMEQLRTRNPEQYERMMEFRERMTNARMEREEKRNLYLNNLDGSKLTAEQRRVVADYKTILENQENIRRNLEENQGGRESFQSMMQSQMTLQQLSPQVQDILIEQYANTLTNGNGADVAEAVRDILNATSTGFPGGPGMGGPGMGGPGMGGPGMGGPGR